MRTHTLGGVQIPEDVWWSDEFGWSAIEQATEYSITGALIVDVATRQAGRAITLTSSANGGWVPRSAVLALQAQRALVGEILTLFLADGRQLTVMHDNARELEAAPVRPAGDLTGDSPYRITLPLLEV